MSEEERKRQKTNIQCIASRRCRTAHVSPGDQRDAIERGNAHACGPNWPNKHCDDAW